MRVINPLTIGSAGSFTRASANGTYFDNTGTLKTAAANVPRFSFNPLALAIAPKFLQEAAATNLILWSRDGTQAAWSKTDTTTALNQVGIDGIAASATLYTQGSAGTAIVSQAVTVSAGAATVASPYVKRGNNDWLLMYLTGPSLTNGVCAWFNAATGLFGTVTTLGTATGVLAVVAPGPNGFYSPQLTCIPSVSTTSLQWSIFAVTGDAVTTRATGATYTVDAADIELGTVATSTIITGAATVTRAADVLTGQGLLYSSVAEPDATVGEIAWVSGTTYAVGDIRTVVSLHHNYYRSVAGAGTIQPNLDTANWTDNGPNNRWASLDVLRNTATVATTSMQMVIAPGTRINALGIVGLQASSVTISVDIGGTNYYYKTISTIVRNTVDWLGYFFNAFRYLPSIAVFDIPLITGATVTLTFAGGAIKVGGLVMNMAVYIGAAQYNAVRSANNFSTVTRDVFGNATLVPRRSVPKTDQKVYLSKANVNAILQLMYDLNAVPALWSGLDDLSSDGYFEALLIVGIYKEMSINLDHPDMAILTLTLEEI
jgi:hypothetical protein